MFRRLLGSRGVIAKIKRGGTTSLSSIVKRGGGVVKLATRTFNSEAFLCVDVWMDTKEAMGCQYVKYGIGSNGH